MVCLSRLYENSDYNVNFLDLVTDEDPLHIKTSITYNQALTQFVPFVSFYTLRNIRDTGLFLSLRLIKHKELCKLITNLRGIPSLSVANLVSDARLISYFKSRLFEWWMFFLVSPILFV